MVVFVLALAACSSGADDTTTTTSTTFPTATTAATTTLPAVTTSSSTTTTTSPYGGATLLTTVIQQELRILGYFHGEPDGILGPVTEEALKEFQTEAGITAGFAFYKYDLTLEGQIMIDNDPDQVQFRKENVGVVAPVPGVGFYINQALRQNLILELRTSFIDLEIGEHNGRIFTTWGSVTWYFARHWGVGVGLTGSDVVYEKKTSKERLKVELRQSALTLNMTLVF